MYILNKDCPFYLPNNPEKTITGPKKYKTAKWFPTLINQHIRRIPEGSCDTVDWSNCAENQRCFTGIHNISK